MCVNVPQLPVGGGGGEGWAQLELTDALSSEFSFHFFIKGIHVDPMYH